VANIGYLGDQTVLIAFGNCRTDLFQLK